MRLRSLIIAIALSHGASAAFARGVVVSPEFSTMVGGLDSNDGVFAKRNMLYLRPSLGVGYELTRFFEVGLRGDVAWVEQLSSSRLDGTSNLLGTTWSAGPFLALNIRRVQLSAHYDPLGTYYPSNPTADAESLSFESPRTFGVGARYRFAPSFFAGLEYVSTVYRRVALRGGASADGQQSFSPTTQVNTWSVGMAFGAEL